MSEEGYVTKDERVVKDLREALSRKVDTTVWVCEIKKKLAPVFETGDFRGICLSKGIDSDRQMRDCAEIVIQTLELLEKKPSS